MLRDVQGGVIGHGSTFHKVQLRAFGTNGEGALGKLASDLQVELKVKGWKCHLTISGTLIEANRVRMSYYTCRCIP